MNTNSLVRVESEFFEWKLPRDVIKIIMLFVDPFVLIALGSTCHSLYLFFFSFLSMNSEDIFIIRRYKESLRSEYWESSTKDYIHQLGLDFTGVHAKCLREKEAFIWIYQHTSIILDLMQNFNILKVSLRTFDGHILQSHYYTLKVFN